jgi:hypothetical protein
MDADCTPLVEAARELAQSHRESDPHTQAVYLDPTSAAAQEIRLVEVTADMPDTGEVLPFRYQADPSQGRDFPVVIVLLSPVDWARLPLDKPVVAHWSTRGALQAQPL